MSSTSKPIEERSLAIERATLSEPAKASIIL
jgi:hypothetical protein